MLYLCSVTTYTGALYILCLTAGQDWHYGGMYRTHKGLGEEGKGSCLESWQLGILRDERSRRCMLRDVRECLCDSLRIVDSARGTPKTDHRYITKLFNNKHRT